MGFGTDELLATRTWEWMATRSLWLDLFQRILGEPGVVLPIGEYVFTWPGKASTWSGVHQDAQASAGLEFLVFWVPLMRITEQIGGLTIAPGMHKAGSLRPGGAGTGAAGSVMFSADLVPAESWAGAAYHPGDLLVFDRYTPHCGLPNTSTYPRLSIDFRVRKQSSVKPVIGVVVAEDSGGITIASDEGGEIRLRTDEATIRRDFGRPEDPSKDCSYLGRRVNAVEVAGRASLVRTPRGYLGPDVA